MTEVASSVTVLDRILCAVDESRESLAAVRRATCSVLVVRAG